MALVTRIKYGTTKLALLCTCYALKIQITSASTSCKCTEIAAIKNIVLSVEDYQHLSEIKALD